ncbi:MAG: ABC-2 type transport system permease protein [Planctomycetota bacterium]|jgi:ABC-2 type transport system permease protein
MRVFLILLRRELQSTFTSFGYFVLLAVVSSLVSYLFLDQLTATGHDLRAALYHSSTWLYILTMVLAPLLTMRLIAEEKRSGSLELLMTAPVDDVQVVGAKFFSSVFVFATFMAPIWVCHFVLAGFYDAAVDWGQLTATTLGVVSIALIYLAVGTLASAACSIQLWAALLAFIGNFFIFMIGQFQKQFEQGSTAAQFFAYVDLQRHMQTSVLGLIDLRQLSLQFSITILLLYWTVRVVETRKWR